MSIESGSGVVELSKSEIGKSHLGLPIFAFEPDKKSNFLVIAGQHGEETEGVGLLSKALRSLQGPLRAHTILCANPDGAVLGTRGNGNGVELNRNFPASNWIEGFVCHRWSTATSQNTELSTGDAPGSEPETTALISYIQQHGIETVVSLHAPLACIDDPATSDLGKWISEQVDLPLVEDIGYPTPGSFGSWAVENGVHAITYEFPAKSIWELLPVHLPLLQKLLQLSRDVPFKG